MAPRTERTEEVRHVEFRASDGADGQTIEGYAAVFNEWADIRDHVGTFRERILPGAFKRSLGQRTPVMQFDHGTHPLIGSLPLGVYSVAREDKNGVFVRGRLSDNWLIQPVRDAVRDKAINGMSIRMRVIDDEWGRDDDGVETRSVKEAELPEMGPVVFPAYVTTSVAMRSLVGALDDDTRAALAAELGAQAATSERSADQAEETSTPDVASGPADSDSPDEPPVASHEANRTRIAAALQRVGRYPTKETPDVHQ